MSQLVDSMSAGSCSQTLEQHSPDYKGRDSERREWRHQDKQRRGQLWPTAGHKGERSADSHKPGKHQLARLMINDSHG